MQPEENTIRRAASVLKQARRSPRGLLALALLAVPLLLPAAGRTEESDFQPVGGTSNWEHTIDVADLEPGRYNIVVRARDEAGNEAFGGPYNVYVDPASDLPTVSIFYPTVDQRTGRELFVVGSANDNEAVSAVEVRVNDGPWTRASGEEFWSATVPLAVLQDGRHTVTARAIDNKGLVGQEKTVPFRLDTRAPDVTLESHDSGVFVTRQTTIEGSIDDANGVRSARLRKGPTTETLALRRGRDAAPRFSFGIDPRGLAQGPHVYWIEATDNTGATSTTPFLFFVDTEPPELEILYPGPEDRVDAQLRFIGRAFDSVGVASISWELSSGQKGTIPLVPGNPYWTLAVDLPPATRGSLTATFTATDGAGNQRQERLRLALDQAGDKPVVTLTTPLDGSTVERTMLAGHIRDDDGAAEIVYSVNGSAEQRVAADAGFHVELDLGPGRHELRLYAVDRFGLAGDEIRTRFQVATPLPVIALDRVLRPDTTAADAAYAPGFVLQSRERAVVTGTAAGLPAGARLSHRVGSTTGQTTVGADGTFSVALPRLADGAVVDIDVWYQNELARTTRYRGFYVQLPAATEGSTPTRDQLLEAGVWAVAPGAAADPAAADPTAPGAPLLIDLPRGSTYRFLVAGGRASAVRLVPETGFLSVSVTGEHVALRADAAGAASGLVIEATVGGRTLRSAPFSVRTGTASPSIGVPAGLAGSAHAEPPEVAVTATDPTGIDRVRSRIIPVTPGGPAPSPDTGWTTAEPTGAGYAVRPSLPSEDGPALIQISARNGAGIEAIAAVPVVIDRTAPEIRIVTPREGDVVNGTITVAALVARPNTVRTVTVSGPAADATAVPLPADVLVAHDVSVTDEANRVAFDLTTNAGVRRETAVTVRTDETADRPRLLLQVPADRAAVRDGLRLSGVLLDDDAPEAITFSVNGSAPQRVATDGLFDVTLRLGDLPDGEHALEVVGYDLGGAASEPERRTFIMSRTDPVVTLDAPAIDSFGRGVIALRGTADDPNGIASVEVSTDSGNTFSRATGSESWRYELDTTLLDDGTHSVLVRATDGAGDTSLLATIINVDNTAPVLELASPADGAQVSGSLLIDGRAADGNLASVRLLAQPLDPAAAAATGGAVEIASFGRPGPFAAVVEGGDLEPGWYNLRVESIDMAGNTTHISRNIRLEPPTELGAPRVVLPVDGAALGHRFEVVVAADPRYGTLTLLANDRPVGIVPVDARGNGTFIVEPDSLAAGALTLVLRSEPDAGGATMTSEPRTISYSHRGPWLSVEAPSFLGFVRDRPFLAGRAGYDVELPAGGDRDAERERTRVAAAHRVERVEVSSDNGASWAAARGTEEWQYRIETTEIPDGRLNLIVRAVYADGGTVTRRHSVIVDERVPTVRLLEPQERDRFGTTIRVVGVTADENSLRDVAVALRPGDKARYEVPSFVQGLYLDAHVLGATYFDIGAGLTFFDSNVRLQAQIGLAPPGRFSGLVLGSKLLANVASLPASFVLGPDFEWLSAALAVGANFSYFTMSEDTVAFTPEGLVLAGMVAQLEFPIVRVATLPVFNTYSFYTEAQLWFISSDVEAGTAFRLSFGVRADVF